MINTKIHLPQRRRINGVNTKRNKIKVIHSHKGTKAGSEMKNTKENTKVTADARR